MQKFTMLSGAICILLCLTAPAAFAAQYFDPYVGYSVGSYPTGITTADVDGDSIPDLISADHQGSSVSVLLGNGNGSFATRDIYDTGSSQYPYRVDTGDMDGDGNLDIVTGGSMGIVIFYGAGDGTFSEANVYYFGQSVNDIVVADFNNDTYLDIATSHAVRDSVGIHISNNDSTYTTHMIQTGQGTVSLATGYLDGDNYVDILVGCNQGTVWNLKNDQSGSFIPTEVHLGNLDDPARVAVTDLNGDDIGDFVVIHAVNDFLFTYFNNGDGTYTVDQGYILTDNPIFVAFEDVNEDNEEDVLICIGTTNEVELYLNQGSGDFSYDSAYAVGGKPYEVAFADFDRDGHRDMVVVSFSTDKAAIFMNRLSIIVSVDDIDTDGKVPEEFTLGQNYPNPFNPNTNIRFDLPTGSHVKIEVFNMLGQSVTVLVDEYLDAGVKEVSWNGVDASGEKVTSGIYLYRITADQFVDSKTMLLLK